jgi:hypothetical protein
MIRLAFLLLAVAACKSSPPNFPMAPVPPLDGGVGEDGGGNPNQEAACTRRAVDQAELAQAREGTKVTIAELQKRDPREDRFTLEGWVVGVTDCAPCPEGADCKPCEGRFRFSAVQGGEPEAGRDLVVYLGSKIPLVAGKRYSITVYACERSDLELELRGYRQLP